MGAEKSEGGTKVSRKMGGEREKGGMGMEEREEVGFGGEEMEGGIGNGATWITVEKVIW